MSSRACHVFRRKELNVWKGGLSQGRFGSSEARAPWMHVTSLSQFQSGRGHLLRTCCPTSLGDFPISLSPLTYETGVSEAFPSRKLEELFGKLLADRTPGAQGLCRVGSVPWQFSKAAVPISGAAAQSPGANSAHSK